MRKAKLITDEDLLNTRADENIQIPLGSLIFSSLSLCHLMLINV